MVYKFILLSLFVGIAIIVIFLNNRTMLNQSFTWLALGDSYTAGEGVAVFESFPYQTVQLLRKAGHNCTAPEVFAKTGWTCSDLQKGIKNTYFQKSYYFVTLLIGVNDQYQGRPVKEYAEDFTRLLEQAIRFTGGKATHVFVLSVPDWSVTTFAAGTDRHQVAMDIDSFNAVNEQIARTYKVNYLDITPISRNAADGRLYLAPDGLHPSAKAYEAWAGMLAGEMQKLLI
jgi:lysophospholipase L1-like esterase